MTQKLVELAKETSFIRIVYTGAGGVIMNLLSGIIVVSLYYMLLYDLHYWRDGFQFKFLIAPGIFIASLSALFVIGNQYTKRNLKVPLFQWRSNPRSAYNDLVMAKLIAMQTDEDDEIFANLNFSEAKELLDKEYSRIRSEYRKIYLVFSASVAIVWYNFVVKTFDHPMFQSLDKIIILFFVLTIFCAALAGFYFLLRSVFYVKSKLGYISDLSNLLEQCHYETRNHQE